MLSFSAGRYVAGSFASQSARDAWNGAEARVAVTLAPAPHGFGRAGISDGTPVARLVIPSIDLDEIG